MKSLTYDSPSVLMKPSACTGPWSPEHFKKTRGLETLESSETDKVAEPMRFLLPTAEWIHHHAKTW